MIDMEYPLLHRRRVPFQHFLSTHWLAWYVRGVLLINPLVVVVCAWCARVGVISYPEDVSLVIGSFRVLFGTAAGAL